jgi:hypothetical protein
LTVIAITLALGQWWQRQQVLKTWNKLRQTLQGLYALATVAVIYFWCQPKFDRVDWLAFTSLLALAVTCYGLFTRFWLLAAAGQLFLVASGIEFVFQLLTGDPGAFRPLAPIAVLLALSIGTVKWFERRPDAGKRVSEPLLNLSLGYRIVAAMMSLWWIYKYIRPVDQCWVLALVGAALFATGGWFRSREVLTFSGVFTVAAVGRFCLPDSGVSSVTVPNLVSLLALAAQQRVAKRWDGRFKLPSEVHATIVTVFSLSLWLFVTRWVDTLHTGGIYLTAAWSVLALMLFMTGMTVRERVYRWLGLGVLAFALGRVVFNDVWQLETIYRILSFMALGIVLLVLGFIYNRHQERIKEWL